MGTFRLYAGTVNAHTGSTFSTVTFDASDAAAIDGFNHDVDPDVPGRICSSGSLELLFSPDTGRISLDGGAPIAFASLPAGFTPQTLNLIFNPRIEGPGSATFHAKIDTTGSTGVTLTVGGFADTITFAYPVTGALPGISTILGKPFGCTITGPDSTVALFDEYYEIGDTLGARYEGTYSIEAVTTEWWCNDEQCVRATGAPDVDYEVETVTADGAGLYGATGNNGWWLSGDAFAGAAAIVHNSRPKAPRQWSKLATVFTGASSMLGGSPAASCIRANRFIYPEQGYTGSGATGSPIIRIASSGTDRTLGRVPVDANLAASKGVLSMLAANETVYYSTLDATGGRVFQLDVVTGDSVLLGAAFAQTPYALCWHMNRLWVGTNNGNATAGKVYWIRPGIDTTWTQDRDLTTDTLGGVCAMESFRGTLYVGTDAASGAYAKVLSRTTTGAWTGALTGTGGTGAKIQNGFLALKSWNNVLLAGYWNPDTIPVQRVESFDGSSWTNVFSLVASGASGARPPLGFYIVGSTS